MRYKTLEELIDLIEYPLKSQIFKIYTDNKKDFQIHQGSVNNHQAWPGGYVDHVTETMNIARLLHQAMNDKRKLSFKLSDALVVLFLHNIEKAFPDKIQQLMDAGGAYKASKDRVRIDYINASDIYKNLTEQMLNALQYVEGEKADYSNKSRVMLPLACFCHMCDTCSARLWFDRPLEVKESWGYRDRDGFDDNHLWGV